jgi:hypothetical protein
MILYQQSGLFVQVHWMWNWGEISKMLHLEHIFVWCWNLNVSGSRSETPGKFWNVVLEEDGKDQFDRSCEKWESVPSSQEHRNILHEIRKGNANWIGHILRRNCLLQQVTEEKIKEGIEVKGRRRRKLLDDLKERKGSSLLKEEALDRKTWRARFGIGLDLSKDRLLNELIIKRKFVVL